MSRPAAGFAVVSPAAILAQGKIGYYGFTFIVCED
jgi:hypothetical protein